MTTLGTDEWAGMDLSVRRGNDHDPSWFAGLKGLSDHYDMIIVGAGISGCVFAERGSRELGLRSIIDKRDHIGGNCYDFINKHGFRVSQYGVHLFHTKFDRVWEYVNRFSEWMPYEHRVKGKVDVGERTRSSPSARREPVNTLFHANVHTEEEMEAWLNARREVNENPANGEESALTRSGKELYEAIFKHYTKKQWDKWPEELDASVLARIPVRTNTDDRYFSDQHQALPKDGTHPHLREHDHVRPQHRRPAQRGLFRRSAITSPSARLTVFTGPIDAYYASQGLPKLEYRSLRFFEEYARAGREPRGSSSWVLSALPSSSTPGPEVDFTRIVEYKHKPNQPAEARASKGTVIFKEFSCDHGEPYYPVPNPANHELFKKYQELAASRAVCFVGRLASYKYFNMDQAFLNALEMFDEVVAGRKDRKAHRTRRRGRTEVSESNHLGEGERVVPRSDHTHITTDTLARSAPPSRIESYCSREPSNYGSSLKCRLSRAADVADPPPDPPTTRHISSRGRPRGAGLAVPRAFDSRAPCRLPPRTSSVWRPRSSPPHRAPRMWSSPSSRHVPRRVQGAVPRARQGAPPRQGQVQVRGGGV